MSSSIKPALESGASQVKDLSRRDKQDPDQALVRRFLGGDQVAFDELVLRHQAAVRATCFRFLGRRALAEEVAQDVFVSVYRNLERFRGDAKFRTWLHRIVINHCKNKHAYRTRRREQHHETLEGDADEQAGRARELPAATVDLDALLDRNRRLEIMREAMRDLSQDQRTLLVLRDGEDRSYEEISELLELNLGTVKSRIFRARKQLAVLVKRQLQREEEQ